MIGTILVPTDGSDHSVRAAVHGRYLARAFGATAHLLAVVDVRGAAGMFDAGGVDGGFVSRLEAEAEGAIEAVEAVADDRVETAIVRGEPAEAILSYADEHDADLIAMGTHGRTGVNRYVAGSVTERVVRHAPVPVLAVRATERSRLAGAYDEILDPTDGSERATAAVEPGLAIAERTGARVHAVNIVDVGDLASSPEDSLHGDVIDRLESDGRAATERIAARARGRGLSAVTEVRGGSPANELLAYAGEHGST